ncbi:glycine-rich domain-containing protein, partial [Flavobacterium sp.]|uniref:immunoglobulin domain-containing protein n=1 Tax=Flavobacterium sp. TaxID=239 RepID=UPI0037AB1628
MKQSYLNSERNIVSSLKPSKAIRSLLMVLFVCLFGSTINAQTTVTFTTTGTSTWTVPCGVTSITVEAWGGGGAGGGITVKSKGGSGGGGGGYCVNIFTVISGQSISYNVGAGGNGVSAGDGLNGNDTTILTLTASGGVGGKKDMGNVGSGGSAIGGTTNTSGGNGNIGTSSQGSAGGNGGNGGLGGGNMTSTNNGNAGAAPGGGGGGGFRSTSTGAKSGGNGGNGQIKITYTLPVIAVPSLVTPSSTTTVCSGSSINLNATSAGNNIYWWTAATSGTFIGMSASGANFTFVPSASATYYAEAVSPSGCPSASRTATKPINVTALPVITTQPVTPTAICAGIASTTISVTAAGTPNYQWRKNGVNLSSGAPYTNVTSATLTITNPAISENG